MFSPQARLNSLRRRKSALRALSMGNIIPFSLDIGEIYSSDPIDSVWQVDDLVPSRTIVDVYAPGLIHSDEYVLF